MLWRTRSGRAFTRSRVGGLQFIERLRARYMAANNPAEYDLAVDVLGEVPASLGQPGPFMGNTKDVSVVIA